MKYIAPFHGHLYSLLRPEMKQELPHFAVIITASGKMDERDLTALLQYGSSQSCTAAQEADTLHKLSVKIQRPDLPLNNTSWTKTLNEKDDSVFTPDSVCFSAYFLFWLENVLCLSFFSYVFLTKACFLYLLGMPYEHILTLTKISCTWPYLMHLMSQFYVHQYDNITTVCTTLF